MPTFQLATAYAASGVVVADGAMTAGSRVVSSATAAFNKSFNGRVVTIEGAGPAGADLVTRVKHIKGYISATKVEVEDAASTTVTGSDLTYVLGVYRLRDLLLMGDVAGQVYDLLFAGRLQIGLNTNSPGGKLYIGRANVSPTNSDTSLTAPNANDNATFGTAKVKTTDKYLVSDAADQLVDVLFESDFAAEV